MALKECDIEQIVMNLTMPEVVTDLPLPNTQEKPEKKKKMRTREKIEKLVSEGAKNYPAYLKLVHTGDSDFSDNEEMERIVKTRHNREATQQAKNQKMEEKQAENENKDKEETGNKVQESETKKSGRKWSFKRRWLKLSPGTPGEEKKDPVKDTPTSEKDEDVDRKCDIIITLWISHWKLNSLWITSLIGRIKCQTYDPTEDLMSTSCHL